MVLRRRATSQSSLDSVVSTSAKHSPITHHQSRHFVWAVRVYHEDADGSGAVYHANYLKFMERARTEWLRSLGFEQTELAARHGVVFVVRSLSIEYLRPAWFNDELRVTVALAEVKGVQLMLGQCVVRGDEQVARASVRIACVNTASFRPVKIPSDVAAALGACAANQPEGPG
jgi:acyl-CoA thioester hydrolase